MLNKNMGNVLVVAAHPDDEILGCGGTMARFISEGYRVHTLILSNGVTSRLKSKSSDIKKRLRGAEKANDIIGVSSLKILDFPDNRMDSVDILDVIQAIEEVVYKYKPVIVMTHHAGDVNIDHRIVNDAVIAACRPQPNFPVKQILFFEVPSSTEWRPASTGQIFSPNYFVDITKFYKFKIESLNNYNDELRDYPHPRSHIAIKALAQYRGAMAGLDLCESFVLGRAVVFD